jgi:hypothetical protein
MKSAALDQLKHTETMIYQLLPESPKSSNRGRFVGFKLAICLAAAFLCILVFVASGEIGELNRGELDGVGSRDTAKDVSVGLVQSSQIQKGPVEKIVLLGERHSGTNWITDHLRECFSDSIEVSLLIFITTLLREEFND